MHLAPQAPRSNDGLLILEALAFSENDRFFVDSVAIDEGTADLRLGRKIVILPTETPEAVVRRWASYGWEIQLRDPSRSIHRHARIAEAIGAAKRIVLVANPAYMAGLVPMLCTGMKKTVVAGLRTAQRLPDSVGSMVAGVRYLSEATFPLPPAIGIREGDGLDGVAAEPA